MITGMSAPAPLPAVGEDRPRIVLISVGALGFSAVMTQLSLMRELLCVFSGNEMTVGILLGNWLLLTGLGTWLGGKSDRCRDPWRVFLGGQLCIALLPLAQVFLARTLRGLLFIRGAEIGLAGTVFSSFLVLLPFCVVSGYLLSLGSTLAASRPAAGAVTRVYIADALGSILGGLLFSLVLARRLDHLALLWFPGLLNLGLAIWLAARTGRKITMALAAGLAGALVILACSAELDALTTALQYAPQRIVFRGNSPYGKLVVTETAGQFNFHENGLPLFTTQQAEQTEETVHYAMAQRPTAQRVLLVSGGLAGTAKEILKYGVNKVTYVELDPLLLSAGRKLLPGSLADPRIEVVNTDGRRFIQRTKDRYDVIILDLPAPSTAQVNRFYTAEFFAEMKRVLAPAGMVSLALGRYENYVSPELARLLATTQRTLERSFSHVLLLPAGKNYFLASDDPLEQDIAGRLEARGIRGRWVGRHYLEGMFTPDRLAQVRQAARQPAGINADFSPVLYYHHLVYWLSQYKAGSAVLAVILAVVLLACLVRLRAVALTLFASGFAAAALQFVLLLVYQILFGSLYLQLGVVITVFMAGLAVGAILLGKTRVVRTRRALAGLALAMAALAGLLPWLLAWLARGGTAGLPEWSQQAALLGLTFLLALLAGAEFPLAGQLDFRSAASTAATLYGADLAGACLGALLASVWLVPLLGVAAVCWIAAGLNLLCGVALWRTR